MATKNILIVVDVQNDFIYGQFSTKQARNIINPIFQEIYNSTAFYDTVIFTKDSHKKEEFSNGKNLSYEGRHFNTHCLVDTADTDIVYPLNPTKGMVVLKDTFDGSLRIIEALKNKYPSEDIYNIYICGVCTDICVVATALGFADLHSINEIAVISDLCAGTSPKGHKAALAALSPFGIKTYTTKQLKKIRKGEQL